MQGEMLGHFDSQGQQLREAFLEHVIKAGLIDNRAALVEARRAIRAAGDPPGLLARLTAVPGYRLSEVTDGVIHYGPELVLDKGALSAMHDEYAPAKNSPKAAYQAELQNRMRDYWRDSFAKRFAAIRDEAAARR